MRRRGRTINSSSSNRSSSSRKGHRLRLAASPCSVGGAHPSSSSFPSSLLPHLASPHLFTRCPRSWATGAGNKAMLPRTQDIFWPCCLLAMLPCCRGHLAMLPRTSSGHVAEDIWPCCPGHLLVMLPRTPGHVAQDPRHLLAMLPCCHVAMVAVGILAQIARGSCNVPGHKEHNAVKSRCTDGRNVRRRRRRRKWRHVNTRSRNGRRRCRTRRRQLLSERGQVLSRSQTTLRLGRQGGLRRGMVIGQLRRTLLSYGDTI